MKNCVTFCLSLSLITICLTASSTAQAVSVFDTVYVPPGYQDGPGTARMFVPEIGNGIGVQAHHQGWQRVVEWMRTFVEKGETVETRPAMATAPRA